MRVPDISVAYTEGGAPTIDINKLEELQPLEDFVKGIMADDCPEGWDVWVSNWATGKWELYTGKPEALKGLPRSRRLNYPSTGRMKGVDLLRRLLSGLAEDHVNALNRAEHATVAVDIAMKLLGQSAERKGELAKENAKLRQELEDARAGCKRLREELDEATAGRSAVHALVADLQAELKQNKEARDDRQREVELLREATKQWRFRCQTAEDKLNRTTVDLAGYKEAHGKAQQALAAAHFKIANDSRRRVDLLLHYVKTGRTMSAGLVTPDDAARAHQQERRGWVLWELLPNVEAVEVPANALWDFNAPGATWVIQAVYAEPPTR